MFKSLLFVTILCSIYGNCVGYQLKFKVPTNRRFCNTFSKEKDKNDAISNKNGDDSVHNSKENIFCAITEELPLTNGSVQTVISLEISQDVKIYLAVFKITEEGNYIIVKESTAQISQETIIHQQISKEISSSNDHVYAIILGQAADTSLISVKSISFLPTIPDSNSKKNITTAEFASMRALSSTNSSNPSGSVNKKRIPNTPLEQDISKITASIPKVNTFLGKENTNTKEKVPFPEVGGLPTTQSSTSIVTIPLPTVSGLPNTERPTTIVTVPLPEVGGLPTTQSSTPIVTIPFPTVSGLPNTESPTTIVTIPFPTVGGLPTSESPTTIVTIPFPTVGGLPTSESPTTIVTIPFPTVGGLPTTENPTTIVTIPFPTVGGLPTTESPATIVTIPFPTISEIFFTTESTQETTPYETDDYGGLEPFFIVMISIVSVVLLIIIGVAIWCFCASGKSSKFQIAGNEKSDDLPNLISANKGRGSNMNV